MTPEQEAILSNLTPEELELTVKLVRLQTAESTRDQVSQQEAREIEAITAKYAVVKSEVQSQVITTKQEFEETRQRLFPVPIVVEEVPVVNDEPPIEVEG